MAGLMSKCPGCGTIVEIEEGKKRASCPKCSTWVDARDAIVAEASMDVRPMADPELATYNSGGYRASVEQNMHSNAPVKPMVKPIERNASTPLAPSPMSQTPKTILLERKELNSAGSIEPSINTISRKTGSPEQPAPNSNSPIAPNTGAPEPDMPLSEFVAELKSPIFSAQNEVLADPAVGAKPVFKPLTSAVASSLQNSASMISDKRQALANQIEQDEVFRQASSFLEQGQFVSSEPLFKVMTERYPEDYRAWWGLLRSMTRDLKTNIKPEKASVYFQKVCDLAPSDVEPEIRKTYTSWLKTVAVKHERDHPSHVADRNPHSSASPKNNTAPISAQSSNMPRTPEADNSGAQSNSSCLKACLVVPMFLVGLLFAVALAAATESALPIMIFFVIIVILIFSTKKKKTT